MKKLIYLVSTLIFLLSCKKESAKTPETFSVTGTLRIYQQVKKEDPVRFETDGVETLFFDDYDTSSNDTYTYIQKWRGSVDLHAKLTYTDTGKTGCDLGFQLLPCDYPHRVVHVVSYKSD